jgi:hypothetical protein
MEGILPEKQVLLYQKNRSARHQGGVIFKQLVRKYQAYFFHSPQ